MQPLLVSTGVVALAEIGDETQLLALALVLAAHFVHGIAAARFAGLGALVRIGIGTRGP